MSAPRPSLDGVGSSTTRILIVSGIRLYRDGLTQVLACVDSLTVVGQQADREAALACLPDMAPDVVLLDMSTPESHALASEVRASAPSIRIVALGIGESEAEVLACAEAGIAGYVTPDESVDELVATVKSVVRGELRCSARVAGSLLRRVAALAAERDPALPELRLTDREFEIVTLLEQRFSNKEIAVHLGIEVATVKNHVHNLLEKLNVHRRADAARLVGSTRRFTTVASAPSCKPGWPAGRPAEENPSEP
jgi:two-component system, NarL family, nitrate/nitrite response regulator NarL